MPPLWGARVSSGLGARAARALARHWAGGGRRGGTGGAGGAPRCVPRVRARGARSRARGAGGGAAARGARRAGPRVRARRRTAAALVRGLARRGTRAGHPRHRHPAGTAARQLARDAGALQPAAARDGAGAEPTRGRSALERGRHTAFLPSVPRHAGASDRSPVDTAQPGRASHARVDRVHAGAVPLLRSGQGVAGRGPSLPDPPIRRLRRGAPPVSPPAALVREIVRAGLEAVLVHRLGLAPAAAERWIHRGQPPERAPDLRRLTVLDPAVGSGAFLLGALEELTGLRCAAGEGPASAVRRDVVAHSLFGVDLSLTAVRLAELRLWLALIADGSAGPDD